MKFSGKMCLLIILKVTKNQAFTFSRFPMLDKNQLNFCRRTCWKEQLFIFTIWLFWWITFFKHLYFSICDNWLCKHVKKVRSSQASISINCFELSKTQFFPNSNVKAKGLWLFWSLYTKFPFAINQSDSNDFFNSTFINKLNISLKIE